MPDTKAFYQDVYSIVKEIPAGRVATYKQIAILTGFPQHARLVGRALRNVPDALGLPCHRVVNSQGRTAPGWPEQQNLLIAEGIEIKPNGCADLKKYLWNLI